MEGCGGGGDFRAEQLFDGVFVDEAEDQGDEEGVVGAPFYWVLGVRVDRCCDSLWWVGGAWESVPACICIIDVGMALV